ncbi:hypothetical protein EniyanLRS_61 [Mycobacterium phage EniyanLRS]|uniref:Uncharacterized protein n=1 Tax=Mycobacterium phage EniyanLRS TaxID=1933770 RepID=A0A2I2MPG2_9CAUD|nr:hypothetical protein EniyanLRS_61 [Mycobacterium phage EniyanLRS]
MPVDKMPSWLPDRIAEYLNNFLEEHHPVYAPTLGKLDDEGYFEVVAEQDEDTGRWERYYTLVIMGPYGSLWGVDCAEGLTEYQDSTEWKLSDTYPVVAVPVTTVTYKKKEA